MEKHAGDDAVGVASRLSIRRSMLRAASERLRRPCCMTQNCGLSWRRDRERREIETEEERTLGRRSIHQAAGHHHQP